MQKSSFVPVSFKIKTVITEPKRRIDTSFKKLTKLVKAKVIIDEIEKTYKALIKLNNEEDLVLDFTEKSFNLKGRESIFTKSTDKKGKHTRIIRSTDYARICPGSPELYTPFSVNWIINGYVVEHDKKKYFEFNDLVNPCGYKYRLNYIDV